MDWLDWDRMQKWLNWDRKEKWTGLTGPQGLTQVGHTWREEKRTGHTGKEGKQTIFQQERLTGIGERSRLVVLAESG